MDDNVRTTLQLTSSEHKKLKIISAMLGLTMKDYIHQCLAEGLKSMEIPSNELLKDFEETDKGNDLVVNESLEEMFKRLGI